MRAMMLDVIFRIVGVDVPSLARFHDAYRRLFWGLIPVPFEWPGTPRYFALRAAAWINQELQAMVETARRETSGILNGARTPAANSVLHSLVDSRSDDGQTLSDAELVDNLRVLFVAGHETTATTLTWATIHLAERPDLVERLAEEVETVGGGLPTSLADGKKLPLCEAVFRESTRLYTPAWFIERTVTEDIDLHGTLLVKGTRIGLCPLAWARDASIYENPTEFSPDRWLGRTLPPTPIELSAFGGGAHFCLGYHLAWLESLQYLVALVGRLTRSKKRLCLRNKSRPKVVFFPMPHPSPAAHVLIE